MNEIWKDVPDYEGYYQVSNLGNVRSLDREIDKGTIVQPRKGKTKKQWMNPDGYMTVKLSKDGKDVRIPVHVLVAKAFIGYPGDEYEINHKDTNRQNNVVENLEWMTHSDNVRYSADLGHYKHFGKTNTNYGNRTLSKKYKEHPELAAVQSRKGKQNGRCVPVIVKRDNECIRFDYLREAAQFFINMHLTRNAKTSANSLGNTLKRYLDNNKEYYGYTLYYV